MGAKSQNLEHVCVMPPGCPKCASTEYKVITVVRQMKHLGVVMGQSYNWITWRRVQCACGQVFMTRTYRTIGNSDSE